MNFLLIARAQAMRRVIVFGARVFACLVVICALPACDAGCPEGYTLQGKTCRSLANSLHDAAAADDDSGLRGTSSGAATATAGASGSASKPPPIDPGTEWMCMKSSEGQCTSCKQDNDCPKRVCEHGFCMDCRDTSQCGAEETCISQRCIPDRKPSSIWTTSGGGQASSQGFKLQLSIGTPSPAASASTGGFKLQVAPGAGLF
jgi:hypothetical protein